MRKFWNVVLRGSAPPPPPDPGGDSIEENPNPVEKPKPDEKPEEDEQ